MPDISIASVIRILVVSAVLLVLTLAGAVEARPDKNLRGPDRGCHAVISINAGLKTLAYVRP